MNNKSNFKLNLKISKIQRLFRINKINTLLKNFRELNLNQNAVKMNFDEFSKLIRSKEVILDTRAIAEYYSNIGFKNKLNGQKILTSFLLKYFSLDILGTEKNLHPEDRVIIEWGENLIDLFSNLQIKDYNSFKSFGNFLVNYEDAILKWLKGDKNRTIESIIISYKNRRDTINEINNSKDSKMSENQKKSVIDEINKQINELLGSLKILDTNFNIKYLEENYQQVYENLEKGYEKMLSGLAVNMKKAFVDKVTLDLKNGEIKSLVFNFLEIGERLVEICPKKYKESFQKKFKQDYITEIFYDQEWNNKNKAFLVLILDSIIMFDSKENEKNNFKFKEIVSILTLNNFNENAPKIVLLINEKIDDLVRLILSLSSKK